MVHQLTHKLGDLNLQHGLVPVRRLILHNLNGDDVLRRVILAPKHLPKRSLPQQIQH